MIKKCHLISSQEICLTEEIYDIGIDRRQLAPPKLWDHCLKNNKKKNNTLGAKGKKSKFFII